MAQTFQLSVVAPDRSVVDEPVYSVVIPGVNGYFGVMAGHAPQIAALRPGLLEFEDANHQRSFYAIAGGFAEVTGSRMTILADGAEKAPDIDIATAEADLEAARKALRGEESSMTTEEATLEIERAMTRIRIAKEKR